MHGFKKSLELVSKHRLLVPLSKPEIIQRQLYRECIHVPMFRGHFLFELFIRKICSCRCGVWSCKSWLVHHGMVKLQEEIIEIRRRYDRNYRRYIYFWCPIFLGILPCDHIMTAIQIWLQGLGFWMTFFGGILISFVQAPLHVWIVVTSVRRWLLTYATFDFVCHGVIWAENMVF